MTAALLVDHVVAVAEVADCEWRPGGRVRQDVNAASSLAYVVAAAVAVVRAWRTGTAPAMWPLWAAVALAGVGSAAYHAGSGDGVQLAHDLPLLAIVGFVAGWQWARLAPVGSRPAPAVAGGRARRPAVTGAAGAVEPPPGRVRTGGAGLAGGGAAAAVAAGAVTWWSGVTATVALAGLGVVAAVAAELVGRLRSLPSLWPAPLLAVVGVGVVAWVAGQPGSPVCEPGSWLQPHAVWHVASALALVWWADRAGRAPA